MAIVSSVVETLLDVNGKQSTEITVNEKQVGQWSTSTFARAQPSELVHEINTRLDGGARVAVLCDGRAELNLKARIG